MTLIISRTLRAPGSPEVSALGSGLQAALQDGLEPTSSAESVRPGEGPAPVTSSRPLARPAKALSAGKETTRLTSHPQPRPTPARAEKRLCPEIHYEGVMEIHFVSLELGHSGN